MRLGEEEGSAAARSFGDNDANRGNRQALNQTITQLATACAEKAKTLQDGLAAFKSSQLWFMGLVALFGLWQRYRVGPCPSSPVRLSVRSAASPARLPAMTNGDIASPVGGAERGR